MSTNKAYAVFEDDDVVLSAIPKLKERKFKVTDVISPFPIHGLDHVLGLKRTRISVCAFMYGATGTSLALLMMWYMNIFDWPMDIGGKPSFALYKNLLAFIPVTFEATVLCAAHGMVITFFLRSKLLPGVEPHVIDDRMSDDRFVMVINVKNDSEKAAAHAAMMEVGATYVKN
ncbi:MAG: DUF3341 domain-containing protein [Bacteroidetes bacterium]|nr:DUF3341 domain-containing protein [Bacteroidota bacterium]